MTKTARVISTVPAATWVRDSISESLRRCGAKVVMESDLENAWEVSGRIATLYCDISYDGLLAKVAIEIVLRRNGKTVLSRTYRSTTDPYKTDVITPEAYQSALDAAMRSLLDHAVPEICRAMQDS